MTGTCTAKPLAMKKKPFPGAAEITQPVTAYLLAQMREWEKPLNSTDPTGLDPTTSEGWKRDPTGGLGFGAPGPGGHYENRYSTVPTSANTAQITYQGRVWISNPVTASSPGPDRAVVQDQSPDTVPTEGEPAGTNQDILGRNSNRLNYASITASTVGATKAALLQAQAAQLRKLAQEAAEEAEKLRQLAMDKSWSGHLPLADSDVAASASLASKEAAIATFSVAEKTLSVAGKASMLLGLASSAISLGDKLDQSVRARDLTIALKGVARESVVWAGSILAGIVGGGLASETVAGAPLAAAIAGSGTNLALNQYFDKLGW